MKIIITLLFFITAVHAQEHNVWYFGYKAGLDFNSGNPIAIVNGELATEEGCAAIANSNGDLLFYSDGSSVWNKNHELMENGQGLLGHSSSSQSATIIPKPNSQTIYYIFTTTAVGSEDGFRYSVVDMNGDNGLGAITEKNILLYTPTCEKVTATWHSNGEDIWVIAHNLSNEFIAYRVTTNGISTNPVISTTGFVMVQNDAMGCMKISPDESKLAVTSWTSGTQLFDFDNSTGTISNPITITAHEHNYGVEFSPSGNVLYLSTSSKLYQYNLLANDIDSSGIEIYARATGEANIGSLQRGPDNKIYIARYRQDSLSVINNPDVIGFGCNHVANAINLDINDGVSTPKSHHGLPNNVLPSTYKLSFDTDSLCMEQGAVFSINAISGQLENILWDFGDGSTSSEQTPTHTYLAVGTYTVKLSAQIQGITRVFEDIVEIYPLPEIAQPSDMVLCDESDDGEALFNLESQSESVVGMQDLEDYTVTYHTLLEYAETGTNSLPSSFTNTSNPQTIYVRMEDKVTGCYATTSFKLSVETKPAINMPDSYSFCKDGSVVLAAPEGFYAYEWSTGETNRVIQVSEAGDYIITILLEMSDGSLCENSKTITVYQSEEEPVITQVASRDWTNNKNHITINTLQLGNYEYSIDGIIYQNSPEFSGLQSGIYTVYVRDKNGCGMDWKEVALLMYPKFFTPNGDGINDTWTIKHSWLEPKIRVHILDRYGKRIVSFSGNDTGWNGKHNGGDLPATDYWFIVERQDGREHRGHFSLIR